MSLGWCFLGPGGRTRVKLSTAERADDKRSLQIVPAWLRTPRPPACLLGRHLRGRRGELTGASGWIYSFSKHLVSTCCMRGAAGGAVRTGGRETSEGPVPNREGVTGTGAGMRLSVLASGQVIQALVFPSVTWAEDHSVPQVVGKFHEVLLPMKSSIQLSRCWLLS